MRAGWLNALANDHLKTLRQESADAFRPLELSGLCGTARLLLPLLLTDRPLFVVLPKEADLEAATDDLRTFVHECGLTGAILPFPTPGPALFRGLPRHPEAQLRRGAALYGALRGQVRAIVAPVAALLYPSLGSEFFRVPILNLRRGEEMTPEILGEALDEAGFRREDPVTEPGQTARRGGVVDIYPPSAQLPVRLEFLGDTIETMRTFDPDTQRSEDAVNELEIIPLSDVFMTRSLRQRLIGDLIGRESRQDTSFVEKLQAGLDFPELPEILPRLEGVMVPAWTYWSSTHVVLLEPEAAREEMETYRSQVRTHVAAEDVSTEDFDRAVLPCETVWERLNQAPALHVREIHLDSRGIHVPCRSVQRYSGDLRRLSQDLSDASMRHVIFMGNAGRAERLGDVLREDDHVSSEGGRLDLRIGTLSAGFELLDFSLRVLSDGDVFPEEVHVHPRKRRGARSFLSDFRDLKPGDLVVHQDHGIGRFQGLETLTVDGTPRDFMVLVYQGGDRLKVPVDAFDRVQKYASREGARPAVDRLGSGNWDKVKRRVRKAMRDMAGELLKLYAERKARPGHAFVAESPWLREFEASFDYEETPDQAGAIADVAADMVAQTPMDRLVCGDVGYGKTEVAMRAAMRAVLDGKQVAVLTPTTILAFQHWKTFRKRFAPFPVTVEMVSRFRSAAEIKRALAGLQDGKVDILIGTHRVLSKDVVFRDLGLIIIDEEQRFGVAAKEKLKHLRTNVDCLTLSATPIPRTLQMGLSGLRDMSVIETPPKDRLSIQTSIVKFSTDTISASIRQELDRGGQIYFVHNRVESIYSVASLIQKLCPEARVTVAHGQMPEAELEKSMLAFIEGRADVLVATTIIENGLDIPRVNTIVINRADRYGLAQLYQLRGRVGRSDRRAYAYLLVPPDTVLSEIARKRLAAIQEFSDLGAGFRIAALDLELRGAGNLLGGEQSGHIEAVGLDLYVKLLEQTMSELQGQPAAERARPQLNLKLDVHIPETYVSEMDQRMSLYKRLSQALDLQEIERVATEMRDRYGPPPSGATHLLRIAAARIRAEAWGISQVDAGTERLHVRLNPDPTRADHVVSFVRSSLSWGIHILPDGVLRVPLQHSDALQTLEWLLTALDQAPVVAGVD